MLASFQGWFLFLQSLRRALLARASSYVGFKGDPVVDWQGRTEQSMRNHMFTISCLADTPPILFLEETRPFDMAKDSRKTAPEHLTSWSLILSHKTIRVIYLFWPAGRLFFSMRVLCHPRFVGPENLPSLLTDPVLMTFNPCLTTSSTNLGKRRLTLRNVPLTAESM